MTKSTFDTLLEHLGYVDLGRESNDRDRGFAGLGNIEQIIQQSLPWVGNKQVELIQQDHDGPRSSLRS